MNHGLTMADWQQELRNLQRTENDPEQLQHYIGVNNETSDGDDRLHLPIEIVNTNGNNNYCKSKDSLISSSCNFNEKNNDSNNNFSLNNNNNNKNNSNNFISIDNIDICGFDSHDKLQNNVYLSQKRGVTLSSLTVAGNAFPQQQQHLLSPKCNPTAMEPTTGTFYSSEIPYTEDTARPAEQLMDFSSSTSRIKQQPQPIGMSVISPLGQVYYPTPIVPAPKNVINGIQGSAKESSFSTCKLLCCQPSAIPTDIGNRSREKINSYHSVSVSCYNHRPAGDPYSKEGSNPMTSIFGYTTLDQQQQHIHHQQYNQYHQQPLFQQIPQQQQLPPQNQQFSHQHQHQTFHHYQQKPTQLFSKEPSQLLQQQQQQRQLMSQSSYHYSHQNQSRAALSPKDHPSIKTHFSHTPEYQKHYHRQGLHSGIVKYPTDSIAAHTSMQDDYTLCKQYQQHRGVRPPSTPMVSTAYYNSEIAEYSFSSTEPKSKELHEKQMYHQKLTMQRINLETALRDFSRIPGFNTHPEYLKCQMKYREVCKYLRIECENSAQNPQKQQFSQEKSLPPINQQFDHNRILINSPLMPPAVPSYSSVKMQKPISIMNHPDTSSAIVNDYDSVEKKIDVLSLTLYSFTILR